jgi:hypothetical protein
MIYIEDINQIENNVSYEKVFFTFTGDGSYEQKIIRGFCESFNGGDKYVLFSKVPSPLGRKTGFTSLDAIKFVTSSKKFSKYICLIDREYIPLINSAIDLKEKIKSRFYNVVRYSFIQSDMDLYASTEIVWGQHKVNLELIVLGKCKRIEENIVLLIENQFGETIEPKKRAIGNFLRQQNMKLHEMIINCARSNASNLRNSFPGLYCFFDSQH